MLNLSRLIRPTLLVDEARSRRNIVRMADRAQTSGIRFRPHFKTHQSAGVGEWFREAGVSAITVSSVAMAEYFGSHGWNDILIASPINVLEMAAINRLAEQLTLHVTIDSIEAVNRLASHLEHSIAVWLELNTGDNRTGIELTEHGQIEAIARCVLGQPRLRLAGLIAHDGQTYDISDVSEVETICRKTLSQVRMMASHVEAATGAPLEISIGDTPSCKLVDDLTGADEMRPGNFVFGDLTQLGIGSCLEEELAVVLACPVVSKSMRRKEIVLQAGSVRLSMASLPDDSGQRMYGRIVHLTGNGWSGIVPGTVVSRLSQELAVVQASDELFSSIEIGDILGVLPVHSCLTVDAMKTLMTLDGETLECLS